MSDVPEKHKIYCSPDTAKKIERAMQLAKEADPWPVICPACEGEPIYKGELPLPFACRLWSNADMVDCCWVCAACDGKGTIVV